MSPAPSCRVDLAGTASALAILAIGGLMCSPLHASERLQQHSQQVRLLVPVETGYELERLLPTVPLAQLVRVEGRDYVQLASFADARVAYRLGRTVQKRTRLPFELAYDAAHPQSDGRWLAQELQASATTPAAPEAVATSGHQPPWRAEEVALSPLVTPALEQLGQDPPIQPDATVRRAIRPVAIQSLQPATVPFVRPHLLAVNPSLHYLFVKLQSPEQLAALRRHAVVAEMGERNGEWLARVGVFTPTPVGRRLLNQQTSRLAAMGYALEVNHVKT